MDRDVTTVSQRALTAKVHFAVSFFPTSSLSNSIMPAARKKKATSVKKTSVEHAYTPTSSVSTSAPAKRSTRQRTTAEADDSDLSSDDQAYAPTSPVAAPVTSTRSTRRRTKSVPGSAAAAEDDAAGRGGKHAKEVYNTLEIRGKIFDLLDKGTLAGMLRLEKAVTASVAEVLYHTIPAGIITRMSRATVGHHLTTPEVMG